MNAKLLIGAGILYYLYNQMSSAAGYINAAGQASTTFKVGDILTFNIPGYNTVWLHQVQNGKVQFDGPFTLPMQPYTLSTSDVGTFQATAYQILSQAGGSGSGLPGPAIASFQATVTT